MQQKRLPETNKTSNPQTRQTAQQSGPGILSDRFPAISKILSKSKDTLFRGAIELETKKTKERGYKQIQRNLSSLDGMILLAKEQNRLLRQIIAAFDVGDGEGGPGGRMPRIPRGRVRRPPGRGRYGQRARARLQRMQAARRAQRLQRIRAAATRPYTAVRKAAVTSIERARATFRDIVERTRPSTPRTRIQPTIQVPPPAAVDDVDKVRAQAQADADRIRAAADADRVKAQAEADRVRTDANEQSRRSIAQAEEQAKRLTTEAEERSRRVVAEAEERARTQTQEAESIRNRAQAEAESIRNRAYAEAESIKNRAYADAESVRNSARTAQAPDTARPPTPSAEPSRVTPIPEPDALRIVPEERVTSAEAPRPVAPEAERVTPPATQPEAERVGERTVAGRNVTFNERAYNRTIQGVKIAGAVGLVIGAMGIAQQVTELYALRQMNQQNSEEGITEEEFQKELSNLAGSVLGGVAGGYVGAKLGVFIGGASGGPWGALAGGLAGGILGGLQGEQAGDLIGAAIFDQLTGSNTFREKWNAIMNVPEETNLAAGAVGSADVDVMGLRPEEGTVPATPPGDSAIQTDRRTQRRMEGIIRDLQAARRRLAANTNNRRLQQAVAEEENKLKNLLDDPRVTISDQGRRRALLMLSGGTEVPEATRVNQVDPQPPAAPVATQVVPTAPTAAPAATQTTGDIEHLTNVVRSSLTLRGQPERLNEVVNHIKQLYSGRRIPSSDMLIQSVVNDYIQANPGTRNADVEHAREEVRRTGEEVRQQLEGQQSAPEPKSSTQDLLTNLSSLYVETETSPLAKAPIDRVGDTERVTAEPVVRSLLREEEMESALPYPENLIEVIGRTEFQGIEIEADKIAFEGEIKLSKRELGVEQPQTTPSYTPPVAPAETSRPQTTQAQAAPVSTVGGSAPTSLATPVALPSPAATGIAPATQPQTAPAPQQSSPGPADGGQGGGDFMTRVNEVSSRLGINPANLLAVMRSESSLNPRAVNSSTGASGLIQFMPRTAQSLGTSVEAIRQMSAADQMPYVERFFRSVRLPAGASAGKLYAYVFLPGRANREVLTQSGENFYEANRGLDVDRDGRITIADLDARLMRFGAVGGAGTATMQAAAPATGGALAAAGTGLAVSDQAQARTGSQTLIVQAQNQQAAQQPNVVPQQPSAEVSLNTRLQKQVA